MKDYIYVRDQHCTDYLIFHFQCELFSILAVAFDQTLT